MRNSSNLQSISSSSAGPAPQYPTDGGRRSTEYQSPGQHDSRGDRGPPGHWPLGGLRDVGAGAPSWDPSRASVDRDAAAFEAWEKTCGSRTGAPTGTGSHPKFEVRCDLMPVYKRRNTSGKVNWFYKFQPPGASRNGLPIRE